jgi:hypothetical protein
MKTTLHLNKAELSQAVADFVAKKLGKTVKIDVSFQVSADYDFHDRPTGTHSITASASFEEPQT